MKRLCLVLGVLALLVVGCAQEEVEGGILDNWSDWEKALQSADTKTSALYGVRSHQLMSGTSISLITLTKEIEGEDSDVIQQLGLVSLRAGGVFTEEMPYGELEIQIPNIIKSYFPAKIRNLNLNLGAINLIPSFGGWVGYRLKEEICENDWDAGISAGIKGIF